MNSFLLKRFRPVRIVCHNGHFLFNHAGNLLVKRFHSFILRPNRYSTAEVQKNCTACSQPSMALSIWTCHCERYLHQFSGSLSGVKNHSFYGPLAGAYLSDKSVSVP